MICTYYLVRVMVLNAPFNNISPYRGGQFYWWSKLEYLENTIDLSEDTDKLFHILSYSKHLDMSWIRIYNFSGDRL